LKNIALYGDKENGKEVIEYLKKLGGKENKYPLHGDNPKALYYIDSNNIIEVSTNPPYNILEKIKNNYKICHLENLNNFRQ
jgi:hypothetical protein